MNHVPRDELLRLLEVASPRGLLLCGEACYVGRFVLKHEHFVHANGDTLFQQIERESI